jgi:hypothetical protein
MGHSYKEQRNRETEQKIRQDKRNAHKQTRRNVKDKLRQYYK